MTSILYTKFCSNLLNACLRFRAPLLDVVIDGKVLQVKLLYQTDMLCCTTDVMVVVESFGDAFHDSGIAHLPDSQWPASLDELFYTEVTILMNKAWT